jgi:hypothetical protein
MLTLLCWYRFVFGTSRPRLFLALFGLCAGLGCSFTYITATATVGCLASWPLLQRPRPSARAVGCLVLGVGVGLAPWLAYNLTHDFEGVRFLIGVFAPPSQEWASLPVRWARKIGALLVFGAPRAYGFTPVAGVTGSILSYAYWALIAVAAGGVALRGVRDPRLLPLALASGVVIAAYAASRFEIPRHALPFAEFRFLHPLHLLLLLLAAVGVSHRRAAAVAGALVVLGGIGQAEAAWHRPAPRVIDYRGYSYVELGYLWQSRLYPGSATFAEAQPLLRRFPGPERRAIYRGLVTFGSSRWIDPTTALRRIGEVDDEYRVYLAQAVGQALGVRAAHGHDAVARLAETLAGEERDHFAFGYASGTVLHAGEGARAAEWSRRVAARGGRWGSWSLGELAAMRCYERDRVACAGVTAAFATLRGADRADAYRGLGRVLAGNWIATATIDLDRLGDLVLPVEHRADIAWGIGWGLREVFSEDRIRVLDWVAGLPVDRRPPAREGVRAADAWYRLEGGD